MPCYPIATGLVVHRLESRAAAVAIAIIFAAGLIWLGVLLGRARSIALETPSTPDDRGTAPEPEVPRLSEHEVFSMHPGELGAQEGDPTELEKIGE